MSSTLIDEAKLTEALKAAIVEILEERKDLVRDLKRLKISLSPVPSKKENRANLSTVTKC